MNFLSAERKDNILKVAGKMSDREAGRAVGVTKSAIQRFRRKHDIPAFGGSRPGPKKKTDKEQVDAVARGYPNHTVALQWEENREIQDLLQTWKR